MRSKYKILTLLIPILFISGFSQNVIIVVIDGARYAETFGAQNTYIPRIWNNLKPQGTIYSNFYNNGTTTTNPGHASILTGNWESIANDGSEIPTTPTLFEYNRFQTNSSLSKNYLVAGANKLTSLTYSSHSEYGINYRGSNNSNDYLGDIATYDSLASIMDSYSPEILFVNFKEVDIKGHSGVWQDYIDAIYQVDSLVYQLWRKILTDSFYQDNTTLFVTNDHGRHDDDHGGFSSHGDDCEGCRHIMLLALGRGIAPGQITSGPREQIDIAPTCAELLSIDASYSSGSSLFSGDYSLPVSIDSFTANYEESSSSILLEWLVDSEMDNLGYIIERRGDRDKSWLTLGTYLTHSELQGRGSSTSSARYHFYDNDLCECLIHEYRLSDVDYQSRVNQYKTFLLMLNRRDNLRDTLVVANLSNYPNPFNSDTTIRYLLKKESSVTVTILNMRGQTIFTLGNSTKSAGYHELSWNGLDQWGEEVNSAVYFIRLRAGSSNKTIKIVRLT